MWSYLSARYKTKASLARLGSPHVYYASSLSDVVVQSISAATTTCYYSQGKRALSRGQRHLFLLFVLPAALQRQQRTRVGIVLSGTST
ncbi:hypothetical protein BOTBODRAFT_37957 [Botryobasidium botryosum FD-172 SS1]|uniref:Uncharacterized protein n=1 Tax=Botryobasidium botryosum (strain FD-172 SS1) TaxID=930990 RepID=A0A067LYB4_BOTB1|nr:hypothetical protein BOTBODRAFT_37957 [Botryobasidium botryosum FD-172 SS1]